MSILSRLEKLEQIISVKGGDGRIKTIILRIVSPHRDVDEGAYINHAYALDGSWRIERTDGEPGEDFEARAINAVPRDSNGFARFILSATLGSDGKE
jgi:hypothetical protein